MSKTLIWRYLKIVTRFSPPWPPFSFSTGPLDPSVEYTGKNIMLQWGTIRFHTLLEAFFTESRCCYWKTGPSHLQKYVAAMKYIKILSLPTTKIADRFGRHQESPQQQKHPAWVFEYSQRWNLEKRELYPPPIRGNKLFCPKANTGTRSHLYKVKNGRIDL